MSNYTIEAQTGHANISPALFHEFARQYLQCECAFQCDAPFSPVPYFLLSMAIELEFKSTHLETMDRDRVKKRFGHNLKKSYDALPAEKQTLNAEQYALLIHAGKIYMTEKGFEYVSVRHSITGLADFPDIDALRIVATKVISGDYKHPQNF
jgi:hypothetical protein